MRRAMESDSILPAPPPLDTICNGGPVSLFLDFDGTLVELAPTPDTIQPIADIGSRLAGLADRLDGRCALVSGRALGDIERHIGPLPVAGAGSHGADVRLADGTALGLGATALPQEIESELRQFASEHGIDYEHKPHGGALHFRSAPGKEPEAHEFAAQLATKHGWSAQKGKCVVELVKGDSDKGEAVLALMSESPFCGSRPYFLGDDLTDEAGFEACARLGGAGILVGERKPTSAHFQLPNVASVHAWLGL